MRILPTLFLIAALAGPAFAGGRRRAVAVSPVAGDAIAISFAVTIGSGSDALLDAGTISQTGSRRKRVVISRRTFAVRVDAANGASDGTVTLRAYLESFDGRSTIRIDGLEMTTIPRVIDARARLGVPITHTLEIEVPASVPEGAFASAVRWEATTN